MYDNIYSVKFNIIYKYLAARGLLIIKNAPG
jgi:hypothetical protein